MHACDRPREEECHDGARAALLGDVEAHELLLAYAEVIREASVRHARHAAVRQLEGRLVPLPGQHRGVPGHGLPARVGPLQRRHLLPRQPDALARELAVVVVGAVVVVEKRLDEVIYAVTVGERMPYVYVDLVLPPAECQ